MVRCVAFSRFFWLPKQPSYILTCFLFCHFDRGGGTKGTNSPIPYSEMLVLHKNCVKIIHTKSDAREPCKNPNLDTGLYGKDVKFQTAFPNRHKYLSTGGDSNLQFETPDAPNGDKCMPPLLDKYSSKLRVGQPQPDENYVRGGSCAFDAARIEAYQKANLSFKTDMLQSADDSLPKLKDLLVMDLAYIHLRSIKWKAKKPSHLGNGAATDD